MTKNLSGIDGLARPHHVVPPADVLRILRVVARDMLVSRQCVADEDGVGLVGIQRTVSLVHQVVARQHRAALEGERLAKSGALRRNDTD